MPSVLGVLSTTSWEAITCQFAFFIHATLFYHLRLQHHAAHRLPSRPLHAGHTLHSGRKGNHTHSTHTQVTQVKAACFKAAGGSKDDSDGFYVGVEAVSSSGRRVATVNLITLLTDNTGLRVCHLRPSLPPS